MRWRTAQKQLSQCETRTAGIWSCRGGQTVIPLSHNASGVRVHSSGVAPGGGGVRPTRQIARRGPAWSPLPCICKPAPPAGGTSRQQLRPPPSQPQLFPSPDYRSANLSLGDSRPPLPLPPPLPPCHPAMFLRRPAQPVAPGF